MTGHFKSPRASIDLKIRLSALKINTAASLFRFASGVAIIEPE